MEPIEIIKQDANGRRIMELHFCQESALRAELLICWRFDLGFANPKCFDFAELCHENA